MTINSYSTLRTAVAGPAGQSFSHRGDALSNFDTFLALTEEEIYSGVDDGTPGEGLRVRELETLATASLSTTSRFLQLPDRFIEARRGELKYNDQIYPIRYVTAAALRPCEIGTRRPTQFTVTSRYEFDSIADVEYTFSVQYYAKAVPISSTNTTNAILTNYPSIYLNGCLSHLFQWALNDQRAALHRSLFKKAIEKANREDKWARVGPNPTMKYMGSVV